MHDTLPDVIADDLLVLFCGINPGLRAAATGHHFMGRSNRFWRVLHLAGFTPHEIAPERDRDVLRYGCGMTSVVERPTARADQLSQEEFAAAATGFEHKVARYAPHHLAFLGKAAYSVLSGQREVGWGRQAAEMGTSRIWVLPNPSGRNRAFSLEQLVAAYRELRAAIS
ncbi:G/U mismatch-specific DNA glycosylase [Sphingomonas sp. PR090111-T3T-6A]|uniref:G/U mismatch-specific DNA glycosylase n=1 Tax=Sphingomonas sp. PR090111-T3T-6A TaxID=685778 RepID=UPI0004765ED7|nr:G/U mismatch-specific DNA glycosylase [Sphingomonas sp. PR090111-T3T-6A]